MDTSVMDSERYASLRSLGGDSDELIVELLQKYVESGEREIQGIKDSGNSRNSEQLRRHLHTIRGASLNLGLNAIEGVLSKMHDQARAEDYERFEAQIALLQEEFDRVVRLKQDMEKQ